LCRFLTPTDKLYPQKSDRIVENAEENDLVNNAAEKELQSAG
jgi:predicted SnoaL-like aldol condensation-catalyzing enzyme